MIKRILLTLLGLLLLAGLLAGIKALQIGKMIGQGKGFVPPPETVTAAAARPDSWESTLSAVGSLSAVQGVQVSAELSGKVTQIAFQSGSRVRQGDLLLRQDTSTEEAQLPGAEAALLLARRNLERARRLLEEKVLSQAEFDTTDAAFKEAAAAADNIRALIAKKTVRAPFSGRLGIRLVDLGQILKEGDGIVSLQSLDPIFVDFLLPQQQLSQVRTGLAVRVTTDALPGKALEGKITAINPEVDSATRNLRLQATLSNPAELLRPGMFASVAVLLPERIEVLAIPATAVLYAPYSDSVFVIDEAPGNDGEEQKLVLRQQFVRLGEKRGDFVAVLSGLQEGERVATTGVFKLRNGQGVIIDNALSPEFQLEPTPENN